MQEPRRHRFSVREKSGGEMVRQGTSDPRNAHRVKCGGGYQIIRKALPGS
jgi:hypothetical protein